MKTINIIESPKGSFSCEVDITVDEWKQILSDASITTSNYKEVLMAYYKEPNHTATCKGLSTKYYDDDKHTQKYNTCITSFCKAVCKHLKRFQIFDSEGNKKYWPVAMASGSVVDDNDEEGVFKRTLRPELVEAIEALGWNRKLTWIPFYMEFADCLLGYKDNRAELLDIVYSLDEKSVDYIKTPDGGHVSDIDPFTIFGIFNRGIAEDKRLSICQFFKERLNIQTAIPTDFEGIPVLNNLKSVFSWNDKEDVQPLWDIFEAAMLGDEQKLKSCFNAVRTQHGIKWNITMGLFWIRPYDYIALDSRNRDYLPSIGVEVFKENALDAEHYFNLLTEVKQKIQSKEIAEENIPEISCNAYLTDIKSKAKAMSRNYWLVGYNYSGTNSQLDRFIEEGIWQSGYNTTDKTQIELAKSIKKGDVLILKSTGTKGSQHNIPFLRIKAIGIVESDIESVETESSVDCTCTVDYITDFNYQDFEGSGYGRYRKTIHKADSQAQEIIDFVENILSPSSAAPCSKYKEYIELLEETHNLVLTGAPGTGKTYMAQAIAKNMGCTAQEVEFVQFHPSYDYTDFVEGLRPVDKGDGQMGFERRDGVFKEFCKRAIKNLVDSQKSAESIANELSWEEKLQQFVEDAIENNTKYHLSNGNEFSIDEIRGRAIVVRNELNEKTTQVAVNTDEIIELLANNVPLNIVRDIRNYFQRKFGTQADSYAFIIARELAKMKDTKTISTANKIERKPFIFIIDEINRGEASKIFGELFYAIDPGYRGKKDIKVKTQYQNLIPESDIFADGFYVPENVYILATMNDIDRSVESMDFAMRRRFTWKEVTPADTQDMLNSLDCSDKAKAAMERINKVISGIDSLGAAYQVGPSYFLKLANYAGDFAKLWKINIEPLLKEYLRGSHKMDDIMEQLKNAYFGYADEPEDNYEFDED